MEEVLGLVQEPGGRALACHGGQGHGIRGDLGHIGAEGWDSEVPLGRAENGSDQGRHEGTRLEYHGQVGPVEKGLGSDGGRGR